MVGPGRRWVHQAVALAAALPAGLAAVSGALFVVLVTLAGAERDNFKWLLRLHQGSYVSKPLYAPILACLLLVVAVSGLMMTRAGRACGARKYWTGLWAGVPFASAGAPGLPLRRRLHKLFAAALGLPLVFQILTGGAYRTCRSIFGLEKTTCGWMMFLHRAAFLPSAVAIVYLLVLAFFLASQTMTGLRLHPLLRPCWDRWGGASSSASPSAAVAPGATNATAAASPATRPNAQV